MEEIVKESKISVASIVVKIIIDIIAVCFVIGIVWLMRDVTAFFTTKLRITNKRLTGKIGLLNTNQLDSPLNKINSVQVEKDAFGQLFNYGTIKVTTASSIFMFKYISKPDEFRTILNNQIELYDEERIKKQALELANAMNQNN